MGSDWVGLKYFKEFVGSVFFGRTLKNTLMISGLNLLFGFSAPIIFAILLNEVVNMRSKSGSDHYLSAPLYHHCGDCQF
mgnify:CR=1 FL=1